MHPSPLEKCWRYYILGFPSVIRSVRYVRMCVLVNAIFHKPFDGNFTKFIALVHLNTKMNWLEFMPMTRTNMVQKSIFGPLYHHKP